MQAEIENLDICYNYGLFKQDFDFGCYINDMLPKWRYFMCRFRTLNHRLPIEIGRYARVDRQQRYCSLCNDQRLGDEFHVLLECSALKKSRKRFLPRYYLSNPKVLKFKSLLTADVHVLNRVGKFISHIFSLFK